MEKQNSKKTGINVIISLDTPKPETAETIDRIADITATATETGDDVELEGVDTLILSGTEYHDAVSLMKDVEKTICENNPHLKIDEIKYDEEYETLF